MAVKGTHAFRGSFHKNRLSADAHAGRFPHVANVKVLPPIIVIVKPCATHSRPHVYHAGLLGNIGKRSLAVIPVKILPSKVIHHVKVWPAVAVVVAPPAIETKAVVIL